MDKIQKGAFLKQGDTIGVVSPSFSPVIEPYKSRFLKAQEFFKDRGYNLVIADSCYKNDGLGISTNPETCARELEEFYQDANIDAIFSAGGGEMMCTVAEKINFDALNTCPAKWFIGYSDNTNFIYPLVTKCHVQGLYSYHICDFGRQWHKSYGDTLDFLEGTKKIFSNYESFENPEINGDSKENPFAQIRSDLPYEHKGFTAEKTAVNEKIQIEGTILGGNLDIMDLISGTPLDSTLDFINEQDKIIWFFEACDLSIMATLRSLWKLKNMGWFKNAAGFVFGRPLTSWKQSAFGVDQYTGPLKMLEEFNVPVLFDVDVGHISPSLPLAVGSHAKISFDNRRFEVEYL